MYSGEDAIGTVIIVVLFTAVMLFITSIAGALIGAFCGLVLGYIPFLGDWIKMGFASFGFKNVDLVQVGAMLGFIGGFFKPSSWVDDKK